MRYRYASFLRGNMTVKVIPGFDFVESKMRCTMFRPSSGKFNNKTYYDALKEQSSLSHDKDVGHLYKNSKPATNYGYQVSGPATRSYPYPRGRMFVRSSGKVQHRSYYEPSASWNIPPPNYEYQKHKNRDTRHQHLDRGGKQVIMSYTTVLVKFHELNIVNTDRP